MGHVPHLSLNKFSFLANIFSNIVAKYTEKRFWYLNVEVPNTLVPFILYQWNTAPQGPLFENCRGDRNNNPLGRT